MIRLAYLNLFQNKIRLVISVGGVGLALLLILSLDAIFTGVERQITAYIDNSGADIFVSQSGVRNLHMASSSLPASDENKVRAVSGVAEVTPILYLTNMIVMDDKDIPSDSSGRSLAYIIGIPEDATMGGPWRIASGRGIPGSGEAVIDRRVAEGSGVTLGDEVQIIGHNFKVVGLSEGTVSLVNSVAFISLTDFAELRGTPQAISFLLVKVQQEETPQAVAARIEKRVPDATVQTRNSFSTQERKVVKDMSTDVITIMNLISFLIGLAVMALTVYTATLSRRKEYGVLKALGARNRNLYQAVLVQAFLSVIIGFGMGFTFTLMLSYLIPRLGINLNLEVSRASLLKVGSVSLVIATLSAILPIKQIAGLDPAMVFRGR